MRSMMLLCTLPLLIAAAPAATTPCPATPAPLPAPLDGWKPGSTIAAATSVTGVAAATLTLGTRADVGLADAVRYTLMPDHAPAAGTKGGLLGFTVLRAGTYRVALGTGAWTDVVRGGTSLKAVAHGHGPACSGIRKMVDFTLAPGAYVLQLSGSSVATVPVLVTPLP